MHNETTYYPLTFPQQGIWQIEKFTPGTSIGNISATLKVDCSLDPTIMGKAVNQFIRNNEAFQLRFTVRNGEPAQYLTDFSPYKLDYFDFSNEGLGRLYEWDAEQTRIPFRMLESPLFYFALVKVSDDMSALYARIHHLIADAWSLSQVGNEVMDYYELLVEGKPLPEKANPSYLEFVKSEQEYLQSNRYQKDEKYWEERYQSPPELTVIKTRKSNHTSLVAKRKNFVLPQKLCDQIRDYCAQNDSSIFGLFHAAFCMYLMRTTGKREITIGTPVLNRVNAREKRTIGMFISTVPLTATIDGKMNYSSFTEKITKEWFGILRHQKYPYDGILKLVRNKNKGMNKLFDIAISYQNAKVIQGEGKIKRQGRWHFCGYQPESLYLHISDREEDRQIIIDYDYLADLFYEREIDYLHDHFVRLLWHALDNPRRKIAKVHMISETEKQQVVDTFNKTEATYPQQDTIHQLFESQARKHPQKPAVIFEHDAITYGELNRKANQLARVLRNRGVEPDTIVGLMMARSIDMVVGILGILKAGGCYLPIDPDYPAERIQGFLGDSCTEYLVVHHKTRGMIDFSGEELSLECEEILDADSEDLKCVNNPEDLAYILYTSGSTGKPKAAMIEHRNVIRLLVNDQMPFAFSEHDVWSLFHSLCFDLSVWEIYGALFFGGTVVVVPKETTRDPRLFLQLLKEQRVTMLTQVPVAFYNLIDEDLRNDTKNLCLKDVVLAGESLKPVMLKEFQEKYPETRLINMYGITETTVYSTYKVITEDEIRLNQNNIGVPMPTTTTYILDENLNPLPIGIMGEIYVGGAGVGRGYLNNPALTSQRFVRSPFVEGEILYRSGDYGRWFPRGEIEYWGRMDHQVKIKGFRIELGEIEKQILFYPGIDKVVVAAREDKNNQMFLCAYVVSKKEIDYILLKEHLMKELPEYMVPAYYHQMDKLPLTASGKVDLKSLPLPELLPEAEYAAPRNNKEAVLVSLWETIFGTKNIGIDDNFFALGGDSLSAVQFAAYLEQKGYQIALQDIYHYPTIRTLQSKMVLFQGEQTYPCFSEAIPRSDGTDQREKRIERTPLCRQILDTQRPGVNAAAITYLPYQAQNLMERDSLRIIRQGLDNGPVMYQQIGSQWGEIGVIALPMTGQELYQDNSVLLKNLHEAIQLAERLGAGVVSLTGLIPSATANGWDIQNLCQQEEPGAHITTGHTTTSASVILSMERMLSESSRDIRAEEMGVLGLGSIGTTVIELALTVLPHPRSIVLCDLPSKKEYLESLQNDLRTKYDFRGPISILITEEGRPPKDFYGCTLIIGATNVPDVLDIDICQPGTLLIDDSGPHCFSKEKAVDRLNKRADILFTEGGVLEAPQMLEKTTYMPEGVPTYFMERYGKHFTSGREITGCILSSLLSAQNDQLKPLVGLVPTEDCVMHYNELKKLGFAGAALHCDDYELPHESIRIFQEQYQNIHSENRGYKEVPDAVTYPMQ